MSVNVETLSLSQLKGELSSLGLPTTTPGLVGEERHEELKKRLVSAQGVIGISDMVSSVHSRIPTSSQPNSLNNTPSKKGEYVMPSLVSNLTIGEIRTRLNDLGENTNTPGLSGEARRDELMKRLVVCLCGSADGAGSGFRQYSSPSSSPSRLHVASLALTGKP